MCFCFFHSSLIIPAQSQNSLFFKNRIRDLEHERDEANIRAKQCRDESIPRQEDAVRQARDDAEKQHNHRSQHAKEIEDLKSARIRLG